MTAFNDMLVALQGISATAYATNVLVMPPRTAKLVDRMRVRQGIMPITPDGVSYARRRRRQARKHRRGWA